MFPLAVDYGLHLMTPKIPIRGGILEHPFLLLSQPSKELVFARTIFWGEKQTFEVESLSSSYNEHFSFKDV